MTKDSKMQMTGATALQLIESMNEAVDAAGSGEWRGQIGTETVRVSSSEAGHG